MKFFIFAHVRSGSTTLSKILQCHKDFQIIYEPFNIDLYDYVTKIEDNVSLRFVLDYISREYNGFKTLTYQLPEELNKYLLSLNDYKVIFLRRKNLLKTIISNHLAMVSKIYHKDILHKRNKTIYDIYKNLPRFDVERIKREINQIKDEMDLYENFLDKKRTYKISFEDLYESGRSLEIVTEIFNFLGKNPVDSKEILEFINPRNKLNTEKSYKLIPILNGIVENLSNDRNGYLL